MFALSTKCVLLNTLAATLLVLEASAIEPVTVTPFAGDPRLVVATDGKANPAFRDLLHKASLAQSAESFCFMLVNSSSVQVVALTIRWTWMGQDGRIRVHDQQTDSLFMNSTPILQPFQKMIVAPGSFIADFAGVVSKSGLNIDSVLGQFDGAVSVSAEVDFVAFSDGVFSGSDKSGSLRGIAARKKVASEIALLARSKASLNEDFFNTLGQEELKVKLAGNSEEYQWRVRIRQMVKREIRSNSGLLEKLDSLPRIPSVMFKR